MTGSPADLRFRFLATLEIDVREGLVFPRDGGDGARLAICYFEGGRIRGERLAGDVLPGGGDWADCRSRDHVEIDVRAVLRTGDGALIYLKYAGLWWTPPGILERVIAQDGERMFEPESNYFRTVARFECADERYRWLNRIIAVGIGRRTSLGVAHDFYELL